MTSEHSPTIRRPARLRTPATRLALLACALLALSLGAGASTGHAALPAEATAAEGEEANPESSPPAEAPTTETEGGGGTEGSATPEGAEAGETPSSAAGLEGGPEGEVEGGGPGAGAGAGTAGARVSALALTRATLAALVHRRLAGSRIAFTFRLSAPARVRVTVARESHHGAHRTWRTLGSPRYLAAARGTVRAHLASALRLTSGSYRLSVLAEHGHPHTLVFHLA